MVMSAVSSVSTPGVLVTVMPRRKAEVTSMLSTPLPKLAISFICSPAWAMRPESIRSVMVGTRTSAVRIASASSAWDNGVSAALRRTSKSSRIRASTTSGSLRVTTTSGFFCGIPSPSLASAADRMTLRRLAAATIHRSLTTIGRQRPSRARRLFDAS